MDGMVVPKVVVVGIAVEGLLVVVGGTVEELTGVVTYGVLLVLVGTVIVEVIVLLETVVEPDEEEATVVLGVDVEVPTVVPLVEGELVVCAVVVIGGAVEELPVGVVVGTVVGTVVSTELEVDGVTVDVCGVEDVVPAVVP